MYRGKTHTHTKFIEISWIGIEHLHFIYQLLPPPQPHPRGLDQNFTSVKHIPYASTIDPYLEFLLHSYKIHRDRVNYFQHRPTLFPHP